MEWTRGNDRKLITAWLFVGVVMVFFQILLGGITRLTGSGLSITRWEIVTGAIPPLNEKEWTESFDLYKQTPQYRQINAGMSLDQFKFIFFWEYIHRLWARTMGFVFLIPFLFFMARKSIGRDLLKRLISVILIASLAAVFGWIMVASGLSDRPWVNAYKLTIHLGLGIFLFIYLWMTWLLVKGFKKYTPPALKPSYIKWLIGIVIIQVAFGGFVSGMKSALNYPSWPKMNKQWIPDIVLDASRWNLDNFLLYDKSGFMPALVQVVHRNLAYIIFVWIIVFAVVWYRKSNSNWRWISYLLVGTIVVQLLLGILTLVFSVGSIPVLYGALHQAVGILLLTVLIYINSIQKSNI